MGKGRIVMTTTCRDCIHIDTCKFFGSVEKICECDFFVHKDYIAPVVKCKRCCFYLPAGEKYTHNGHQARFCWLHSEARRETDYCSQGRPSEKQD